MQSSSPIPGLKGFDPPAVDLGFPLRRSPAANRTVGEALKASYLAGAADGFSAGQTVGYAEGRVGGVVEGSVLTAVAFGLIFFCGALLMRLSRP